MNTSRMFLVLAVLLAVVLFTTPALGAGGPAPAGPLSVNAPVGQAFTYQGMLREAGNPANGLYDFQFILYNSLVGGAQVGPIVLAGDVPVSHGLFVTVLDFGAVFTGDAYYLDISVRPGASTGAYTPLTPRQAITPAPYSNGLALPYSGSMAAGGTLFSLSNPGNGQAASFGSSSTFATLYVSNNGTGGGLRSDTGSSGLGSALTAYNYGVDRYGLETELVNAANPRAAIYARTAGNGQAGDFEINSNTNGDALFARTTSSSASSYAGIFVGNVSISGTLSKSAGSFRIDHPLYPSTKYLQHSFVESPDMMNIYNGNVTLDANGEATVTMPDWFEALNMEFRYQLTPIGGPGPGLYIAQEVVGNQFQIAGGSPGLKVSWQVTGIRHDAYAVAHPIEVEVDKPPSEQGTYLTPEAHGQSADLALDRVEHPLVQPPAPETGKPRER